MNNFEPEAWRAHYRRAQHVQQRVLKAALEEGFHADPELYSCFSFHNDPLPKCFRVCEAGRIWRFVWLLRVKWLNADGRLQEFEFVNVRAREYGLLGKVSLTVTRLKAITAREAFKTVADVLRAEDDAFKLAASKQKLREMGGEL